VFVYERNQSAAEAMSTAEAVVPAATYILNQRAMKQSDAEAYCVDQGGRLASFLTLEEQVDVEQYFVSKGWLYPKFYQVYWIGLQVR
jgi:hypothetical protein